MIICRFTVEIVVNDDSAYGVQTQLNSFNYRRILSGPRRISKLTSSVSFTIHAHVIHTAPFRLLLGRPFHQLLLCWLEDHPDHVDVSIRDTADPAQLIAVLLQARQGAQVEFVSALTSENLLLVQSQTRSCRTSLTTFTTTRLTWTSQGRPHVRLN